jgi:holo-[acyl-carrier protein] synthase
MAVLGVGTDIVKVSRIEKVINRTKSFIIKAFTEREICYFNQKKYRVETIAGFFAAKEAISKALGTGFRGFGLQDIEIYTDALGKPEVNLSQNIINKFGYHNIKIHLSISHTDENAIAFAVLEEM